MRIVRQQRRARPDGAVLRLAVDYRHGALLSISGEASEMGAMWNVRRLHAYCVPYNHSTASTTIGSAAALVPFLACGECRIAACQGLVGRVRRSISRPARRCLTCQLKLFRPQISSD